jgi:hypothetical protein
MQETDLPIHDVMSQETTATVQTIDKTTTVDETTCPETITDAETGMEEITGETVIVILETQEITDVAADHLHALGRTDKHHAGTRLIVPGLRVSNLLHLEQGPRQPKLPDAPFRHLDAHVRPLIKR